MNLKGAKDEKDEEKEDVTVKVGEEEFTGGGGTTQTTS